MASSAEFMREHYGNSIGRIDLYIKAMKTSFEMDTTG